MSRVITLELPPGMKFYLDHRQEVSVQFTDKKDRRRFPITNPIVEDAIRVHLAEKLGHLPSPSEWEHYLRRCRAQALEEFRGREDVADLQQDGNDLVSAIREMMADRLVYVGSQEDLYVKLHHLRPNDDWPKPHRGYFAAYLRDHTDQLREVGIQLTFLKRTKKLRPVQLLWIDYSKLPEEEMEADKPLGLDDLLA